ncbi:hypothetical protein GDO81_014605 [Engystomops pustulosus]|uniref:Uncharacterized protein n=1 Tax=Engystomops pustulosus TaxID=76066 RepID=A0AAV7BBQ7_ENGPU|nr:hypothetical protein GDO81_014605 [Engystomops pustulosus]
MDPNLNYWGPYERSGNLVSSSGYERPPPSYSESVKLSPLNGINIPPPGFNPNLRIPTTPVYSPDLLPPYSALPPNMAYVCAPYPCLQPVTSIHGLPSNDVITNDPTWAPVSVRRTKDHMSHSILSLFLCLPLGIVALIYSFKTRSAAKRGDLTAAEEMSRKSLTLNKISRFGVLIIITLVALFIFFYVRKQLYITSPSAG